MRPKKPCARPGCPELIERGTYCDNHRGPRPPDTRPSSYERGYDGTYLAARRIALRRDKECRLALDADCTTKATIAHHDPPHVKGEPHDPEFMFGVCRNCHERVHGRR